MLFLRKIPLGIILLNVLMHKQETNDMESSVIYYISLYYTTKPITLHCLSLRYGDGMKNAITIQLFLEFLLQMKLLFFDYKHWEVGPSIATECSSWCPNYVSYYIKTRELCNERHRKLSGNISNSLWFISTT